MNVNHFSWITWRDGTGSYSAWDAIGGMWDTDTRRDEIMERYGIDVKERESNLLAYHTRKGM